MRRRGVLQALGIGGLLSLVILPLPSQAEVGSGTKPVIVPITPKRVLDTRTDPAYQVGGLSSFVGGVAQNLAVTGSIPYRDASGLQTGVVVPAGSGGVVLNVTIVGPTAAAFFSVRPGDATGEPQTSNLNVTAGQAPTPNAVTVAVPTAGPKAGQINLYLNAGQADVLIDVVAYLDDHTHDDRYYRESEVDSALAAKADASSVYTKTEVDTAVAAKADASSVYTKGETDALVAGAASRTILGRPGFHRSVVDTTDSAGIHSSMTMGFDGLPIIAQYAEVAPGDGELRVTHCNDVPCTSATSTTIDSEGDVGRYPAITIGTDMLAVISYYDATNGDLKVAACTDLACTSAFLANLDDAGDVGKHTSITIATDDNPVISYYDASNAKLKVVHCDDQSCASGTPQVVGDAVADQTSIVIGGNGYPYVAYRYFNTGAGTDQLRMARCSNQSCSTLADTETMDPADAGAGASLTLDQDGIAVISYFDTVTGDLKLARCNDRGCTGSATTTLVDGDTDSGILTSVALGIDGMPIIGYLATKAGRLDPHVVHCNNSSCTTKDTARDVGKSTETATSITIAIGVDGLPFLAYGATAGANPSDLKTIRCGDVACSPYFHRLVTD